MISSLGKYIVNFIIIILAQVLILNNIDFGIYINPFLYLLIILSLPVNISNWLLFTTGFITGLIIDAFTNSIGLHASATVFLCFTRPYILKYFAPRDGYEPGSLPVPSHFGNAWFFKYILIGITAHHFFLFFTEAFTFTDFTTTLSKIVASTIVTSLIIMIAQMFGKRNKRR
ncbi:rod shape-determining protein MreD [Marinilabiliaceae bacterium ANBcel2]|nr:rod shape-determining protein MreD [Marinilabiliaceae bacterium ANBcel2]